MKIQTALVLAMLLAVVPDLAAQRGGGRAAAPAGGGGGGGGRQGGGPVGGPGGGGRAAAAVAIDRRVESRLPSTNILPMTNPVAPIVPYRGNPALGNPAVRTRPAAAAAAAARTDFVFDDGRRGGRRDKDNDVIIVGGAYLDPYAFYSPYYAPYYYYPYMTPAPIPGQLPGVYSVPEPVEIVPPDPALYAVPPAGGGAADFVEVFEPRMIITPPEPERAVEPPALGTSRMDVLSKYGQPWGTISTRSKETLYFRNLTVVLEEGKVTEVRSGT